MTKKNYNYGTAILSAFEYLLKNYPEAFVIDKGYGVPSERGKLNDRLG